jgi:hypothetical protein
MATQIGVDDASPCVDQEHAGRQRIQTVGKRRRLDLLEIDDLGDQQSATDMGHDERESPTHLVVDETFEHRARDHEGGASDGRLVQIGKEPIHQSLWIEVLLCEPRSAELLARKAIGHDVGLFDGEKQHGRDTGLNLKSPSQ